MISQRTGEKVKHGEGYGSDLRRCTPGFDGKAGVGEEAVVINETQVVKGQLRLKK